MYGSGDPPPFFVGAENYEFREIARFPTVHPDSVPHINEHTIFVGSAGAGKSMLMRQMCWRAQESDRVLPLYVHAERWVSQALAESLERGATSQVARARTNLFARAGLSLGVLYRVLRVVGKEAALACTRVFPGGLPARADDVEEWIAARLEDVSEAIEWGKDLDEAYRRLPSLRTMLEHYSTEIQSGTGRKVIYFLDQLDRVPPTYFEVLAEALGRTTSYLLVLGTRPSPGAPEPTVLQLPSGHFVTRWIGVDWSTREWQSFLQTAATDTFGADLVETCRRHLPYVASVVGPSVRNFMRILNETRQLIDRGTSTTASLHNAVAWAKTSFEADLEAALAGYPNATKFLRLFKKAVAVSGAPRLCPRQMQILPSSAEMFLQPTTEQRLRVAVKEGLLVPHPASRYGLDNVIDTYSPIPLGAVAVTNPTVGIKFADTELQIEEAQFLDWSADASGPRRGLTTAATVRRAICYSCEPDDAEDLVEGLTEFVGLYAPVEVLSHRHQAQLRRSRELIRAAVALIVQLEPLRYEAAVEIGLAIAARVPVVAGVADPSNIAYLPPWLASGVIDLRPNGIGDLGAFARSVVDLIDQVSAGDEVASWKVDPDDTRLTGLRRELQKLTFVGTADQLRRLADATPADGSVDGITFIDVDHVTSSAEFYAVLRAMRISTASVFAFSGDCERDLLTATAMAIHTDGGVDTKVPASGGRVLTIDRRPIALVPAGTALPSVKWLVEDGRRGLFTHDAGTAVETALEVLSDVRRRVSR